MASSTPSVLLSRISTKDLRAEIARREKKRQDEEYAKLCKQYPCPECGGIPRELSSEAVEEHRFAPRDPDTGEVWLWAPYEMGTTSGMTYQVTVVCENGHTWRPEPMTKWFDNPKPGPPILGRR